MAKTAFNATVVAAELNLKFRQNLVISSIVNRNYEGELVNVGDTVKIIRPLGTTIRPYSNDTDITVDEVDASENLLVADQGNYFAFYMHDNENASKYVNAFISEDAYALIQAADAYVLGKYADSDPANQIALASGYEAADFVEAIRDARARLTKQSVPEEGRFVVIGPDELKLVEDVLVTRNTQMGDQTLRAGFVGQLAGFNVFVSPALKETGTSPKYRHCMFGHTSAITYADAISQIETMRSENRFADLVRGLHVYGAKTIRPEAIGDLRIAVA